MLSNRLKITDTTSMLSGYLRSVASQPIITSVGTLTGLTVTAPINGSITGTAGSVTTIPNLTGEVTSVGNATTLSNTAVINKVLTGYTSGAGTVAATDNILQAIQKLNGNDALKAPLTSPSFTTPSLGVATATSVNASGAITATTLAGTLQTAAQPIITSVGTLTGLTVTAPINGSVTGSAATVTNASQPSITSVGTLTGLTVTAPINGSITGRASLDLPLTGGTLSGTLTGTTINATNLTATNKITASTISSTGGITAGGPIGYSSGGSTVTQLTNKSTGVTLNNISGQITMNNASLGGFATVTFTVTNSFVGAKDVPFVVIAGGTAGANYQVTVTKVLDGSFNISVNNTGGAASEAIVLNFVIFKGA
jgi:hypothetical protein